MIASDHLHQLIQSLSKGEKWHFKVYTGKHANAADKNYIRLFDAIEKQQVYDEEAIKKHFAGEKFLERLPVTKAYLYDLILESLDKYELRFSLKQKYLRTLHYAEILHFRGLREQALKQLVKARKMAEGAEMPLTTLERLHWERILMNVQLPLAEQATQLRQVETDEARAILSFQNTLAYDQLYARLFVLLRRYGNPSPLSNMDKFDSVFGNKLMKNEKTALTARARSRYYMIKAMHESFNGNVGAAYLTYKKLMQLMDEEPEKISDNLSERIRMYIAQTYNFLNDALMLRRFDKYFEQKLRDLYQRPLALAGEWPLPAGIAAHIFQNRHIIELHYYTYTARFEEGMALLPQIEEGLRLHAGKLGEYMYRQLQISAGNLCFAAGNFSKALDWYNRLPDRDNKTGRGDLLSDVRIIKLLVHLELGNTQLLAYHVRNLYRYLMKAEMLFPVEKLVLQFFQRELPRIYDKATLKSALKRLKGQMEKLSTASSGNLYEADYFNLFPWLQSRIEGRPLPEIIKERANNKSL